MIQTNVLKGIIATRGMSQRQLAKQMGITNPTEIFFAGFVTHRVTKQEEH